MKINRNRLMERLKQIGEIGKDEAGISREAFSANYYKALKKVRELMEEEDLEVTIDKVGNIYGKKKGKNKNNSPILIGSHLDTVKNGGLYDGNLGFQGALECISVLNNNKIETENDIIIVGFNAEEGGLLGGTFGSRVAMGNQKLDTEGVEEKLNAYDLIKDDIFNSKILFKPKCFIELHIEQGAKLYSEGINIGIVEGIVGITRYKITIIGEQNHAGTTLMQFRKDALVAASQLVSEVYKEAQKAKDPFVATVGKLELFPNFVNVVPGKVEMILEIRDMEQGTINNFLEKINKKSKKMKYFDIKFELYNTKNSTKLSEKISKEIENSCEAKGMSCKRMYSGAGHDAMELTKTTDTALIFIPSKDGISHNKDEFSSEEDIVNGVEVLLDVILRLDAIVFEP